MKRTKCDIVIIDSGISEKQLSEFPNMIIGYKSFCNSDTIIDSAGHGTAIFSNIIRGIDNIKIYIIKVFDNELFADELQLLEALRFIRDNLSTKIVHMSFGITLCSCKKEMEKLCAEIYKQNTLIVSAFDNNGAISYPAAFPFVIGVDSSNECRSKNEYTIHNNSLVNIGAYGRMQRVAWTNKLHAAFVYGSSFAAANITNILYKLISNNQITIYGKDEALEALEKGAKRIYYSSYSLPVSQNINIKKAIILPYNKEMHSLINFPSLLQFKIMNIFDFAFSGNIGKRVKSLFGTSSTYTINNIDNIDWSEDFDTVIVGHLGEIERITGRRLLPEIIDRCIKNGKRIYALDYIEEDEFSSANLQSTSQIIDRNVEDTQGKLSLCNTPVLGIWGTSSKQGKFTLQLFLREKFLSHGYSVAQLGTEPTAPFFGFDAMIHMGYNSTINLNFRKAICYINKEMEKLDRKEADIIIVGAQSNTALYYPGNISQYPTAQIELLYGTMPDAVILCVNVFDDIDYIERSISQIQSLSYGKVIALVLSPFFIDESKVFASRKIASDELLKAKKAEFSNYFQIPIFAMLDHASLDDLFDHCVRWFENA